VEIKGFVSFAQEKIGDFLGRLLGQSQNQTSSSFGNIGVKFTEKMFQKRWTLTRWVFGINLQEV